VTHQRIQHEKWGLVELIHTSNEWFAYRDRDGKTTRFSYEVRGDLLIALDDDPDPFEDNE